MTTLKESMDIFFVSKKMTTTDDFPLDFNYALKESFRL